MNKKIKNYFIVICSIILVGLILSSVNSSNSSNWLIFTPKSIGSYEKAFSETLFTFSDKNVFFNDQAGNIYSIDKNTGKIIWSKKIQDYSPFATTLTDENNIAINSFDSNLYLFNSLNGNEVWRYTNPNNTYPDTPAITDMNDENIFFGDRYGMLYAINKLDGLKKWENQQKQADLDKVYPDSNPIHFGRLFQDENILYVRSSTESKLISINKSNGDINWETEINYSHKNLIIRNEVIIANDDENIYAINKNNGQILWEKSFSLLPKEDEINNDYLFLVSGSQKLEKVSLLTGEILWSIETEGEIKPETISNEKFGFLLHHIRGYKNNLIVFDKISGKILWELVLSTDTVTLNLIDDYLFVGSSNGELYKIDYIQKYIAKQAFISGKIVGIFKSENNYIIASISEGNHALISKLSENFEDIWTYKTPYKVAEKSIFFNDDRIFFTDEGRQLVGSIDVKINKVFDQNSFIFNSLPNKNKEEISDMIIFFNNILPQFLKEKNYNSKTTFISRVKNLFNNYVVVKKKDFEIEYKYDQSIIEITVQRKLKNLGIPLDENIQLSAIITSPSNKKYDINGFNYEKNTWKVRFRPDEIGTWSYKLNIRTPSIFNKINFKDKFNIDQISNIQYIQIDESKPSMLGLEGGSEFYPLGLEDVILDRNFDNNPLNQFPKATSKQPPKTKEDIAYTGFEDYFKEYSDAGFNLFRWGVGNASFTLWKEQSNYKEIDLLASKYGDNLVKELRDQNYHIMMTVFGFHPPFAFSIGDPKNKAVVKNYLDSVIPRYASYIDIWEITNEAEVSDEWLEFVINYIKQIDPYHHPISTNWDKPQMQDLNLLSYHWYGSENISETALTTETIINNLKQFNKPLIFSEIGNINYSWDENSADRMRIKLWTSFFNQAYLVFWNQPGNIYQNAQNANIYLGPAERNFTKAFSDISKSFEKELEPFNMESQSPQIATFGLRNENMAYIYINKLDASKTENEIVTPFIAKNVQWLDPSSGAYLQKQPIESNKIVLPSFNLDIIGEIEL